MRKRERALWGKGTSGVLGPRDSLIYQHLCLCFQNIPSAIIPLAFQYEQKERKATNNYDRYTSKGMGKGERNKSVNRTTNNRITGGQFELWRMGEPNCWSDVLYAPCTYSESCWLMCSHGLSVKNVWWMGKQLHVVEAPGSWHKTFPDLLSISVQSVLIGQRPQRMQMPWLILLLLSFFLLFMFSVSNHKSKKNMVIVKAFTMKPSSCSASLMIYSRPCWWDQISFISYLCKLCRTAHVSSEGLRWTEKGGSIGLRLSGVLISLI